MRKPELIVVAFCAIGVALALTASAWGRDPQPVIPEGALAHAADALEKTGEGQVLEIRLADEKGDPVFEAALVRNDTLRYMRIASAGADATEIETKELPAWAVDHALDAYMRSIVRAEVPIARAIARAEQRASAPAIGAGLAKPLSGTNAVLAYYVETIEGDRREMLAVDARSGAFIANPEALYEPRTPVKLARRLAPP
jgi:hypothetical protein